MNTIEQIIGPERQEIRKRLKSRTEAFITRAESLKRSDIHLLAALGRMLTCRAGVLRESVFTRARVSHARGKQSLRSPLNLLRLDLHFSQVEKLAAASKVEMRLGPDEFELSKGQLADLREWVEHFPAARNRNWTTKRLEMI